MAHPVKRTGEVPIPTEVFSPRCHFRRERWLAPTPHANMDPWRSSTTDRIVVVRLTDDSHTFIENLERAESDREVIVFHGVVSRKSAADR